MEMNSNQCESPLKPYQYTVIGTEGQNLLSHIAVCLSECCHMTIERPGEGVSILLYSIQNITIQLNPYGHMDHLK